MSDIRQIMADKGLGKRNSIGDVWDDSWCADAAAEITRLRALVEELKTDRIRINDEAEMEIKGLQSAFATAREEGRREGLEEAISKLKKMNVEAREAWKNPTTADEAYIEGREEAVEIIESLKEKQP